VEGEAMQGKVALVTGAASGMGRAAALGLAAQGCHVACVDINSAAAEATATAARAQGVQAGAWKLDVARPGDMPGVVAEIARAIGPPDFLLHFAAIWEGTAPEAMTEAQWDRMLGVNLKGTFFMCQAVFSEMKARRSGRIVLTASDAARLGGVQGGPHYVASKGGIIALTRSLAKHWGPHGITVNAINPGVIETPMTASWPKLVMETTVQRTPLGRLGTPEDVADVAIFLVSDAARFMTGEIVEVNGGLYFD
jgi:NAD(P)-dependent dehydrogenase (short-subunit alcohol dehydrogenase family)